MDYEDFLAVIDSYIKEQLRCDKDIHTEKIIYTLCRIKHEVQESQNNMIHKMAEYYEGDAHDNVDDLNPFDREDHYKYTSDIQNKDKTSAS